MPFLSVGVKKPIKLAFIIAICVTLVATAFLSYFNYSELLSSQLERSAIQSQLDELSTQNSNFQKYFNELQNNYSSFQSGLADLQTRLDNLQSEYDLRVMKRKKGEDIQRRIIPLQNGSTPLLQA